MTLHNTAMTPEIAPHANADDGIRQVEFGQFELDLDALSRVPEVAWRYQTTPRFPESYRDLALVVDAGVPSNVVRAIIERHKLVVRATPFDIYSGPGIPDGKVSIAYAVVFQSPSGTLTAKQVDRAQQDILHQLQRGVDAVLRE